MKGAVRILAGLAILLSMVAGAAVAPARSAPAETTPTIELVSQTPIPTPTAMVQVTVRLPGVPTDGNVLVTVYGRVRSRSELAASMDGDSLRNELIKTVTPVAPGAGAATTIKIDVAAATGGNAGVYPLELVARDAAGTELATLVTHLIVPPSGEGSPPLAVTPLVELATTPAIPSTTGVGTLDDAAVVALAGLVDAVTKADTATVDLVVGPETLDALTASGEAGAAVAAALRALVANHPVLAQPYVAISLDALTEAGLSTEVVRQLDAGRRTVEGQLDTQVVAGTWLAGTDLGAAGLHRLEQAGTEHTVVRSAGVEPLPDGVLALSLAQPFLLDPPRSERAEGTGTVDALAIDPIVEQRLTSKGTAALVANRTAAELAAIWFEQPGIPRAAVLPLGIGLAPGVAVEVLRDVVGSPVFRTTTIEDAFTTASPLLDAAGDPVHRALTPGPASTFSSGAVAGVRGARGALESTRGMVGADSPLLPPLDDQLLLATADQLDPAVRMRQATSVQQTVDALEGTVTGPASFTLTLTSRKGTIPLTLRNSSGLPLNVVIHLDSPKLEFPKGNEMPVVLDEPVQRLEIPVRSRASGAFRLDITVTTPDGAQDLVTSRYTVRSTAVAGAGLLLSIGAGLFLLVWWARHWHKTRRNARLVAAHAHPATAPE